MKKITFIAISIALCMSAHAQKPLNWHTFPAGKDSIYGADINTAYQLLKGKKSSPVTVAIIGAGFDIEHEDLKDNIWTNPKEKPYNGKDDDKNGYIDDIHGWNFLGKADGTNITYTSEEGYREFEKIKPRFMELLKKDSLSSSEHKEMLNYLNLGKTSKTEAPLLSYYLTKIVGDNMGYWTKRMQKRFPGCTDFTFEQYTDSTIVPGKDADPMDPKVASYTVNMLLWNFSRKRTWNYLLEHRYDALKQLEDNYQKGLANVRDERNMIGDNLEDINDCHYGNNDLMAGDPSLGTGVMGIIAAKRNNGLGIDGIADNAKLMLIRAIPEGDEYDKDVALSIRYAANNGARVILLTCAKPLSPHKEWVDAAIKEAEKKNVLIVHPVGDEAHDIDSLKVYPSLYAQDGTEFKNFINVAASSLKGEPFQTTNYGKKSVNVFAPGDGIYTTDTGDNYFKIGGSATAAAVVAGEAALLTSYFPKLSAAQIKELIVSTATTAPKEGVFFPYDPKEGMNQYKKTTYDNLCQSAGIVNFSKAVEKALKK